MKGGGGRVETQHNIMGALRQNHSILFVLLTNRVLIRNNPPMLGSTTSGKKGNPGLVVVGWLVMTHTHGGSGW